MKRLSHTVCVVVVTSLVGLGTLQARSLDSLTQSATLVVLGSTTRAAEAGGKTVFDIAVDRVLKGTFMGVTIQAAVDGSYAAYADGKTYTGLWFLVREGQSWKALPARSRGRVVSIAQLVYPTAAVPSEVEVMSSDTPLERAALQVAAAADPAKNDQLPGMLLEALGTLDTPAIRRLLKLKLNSQSAREQAEATAALLVRGEIDALKHILANAQQMARVAEAEDVSRMLKVMFRNPDPEAVRLLIQIAGEAKLPMEWRDAAVSALRAMHPAEAMPFFASLLESENADWRMLAVFAISAFVNGAPMQTSANIASMEYLQLVLPAPFKTEETVKHYAFRRASENQEARLVAFWRQWWADNYKRLQ